ncbi:SgrR family transcriptional regulator [Vibrio caribbeanicus]|uniref:SgrR sugar-phosphate stress transcriptional activator of SgrS small RNA n=1 Tax=Vibrio caribbeanicus ATCC BAA-2122 TaxID=796620 RepID=E3BKD1_9VIBR|nr:SgrR family transcriptional regulator [Vibrio caribbeanicus]EFP96516.1 SgrR sugar-phosphate stress transcriptional activator of SgrS small RNA [Vibrio caribbeanicus ATCC BAA-2122]
MSSPRLRVQFETLFEHYQGKSCGIQLEDITEILFCTRRNARIVLNKMEEEGWLEWHPAAGRGKLSQLVFKRSRADVSENLARRYLEEGKITQALNVLDQDKSKLAKVLDTYLGIIHQEDQQVVRLPYYRPLSMLNPTFPIRRSELHIIQQVFSGLVTIDDNDDLQPDLAHAWEMRNPRHWRFFIRPSVRFHSGDLLTMEAITTHLLSLRSRTLFTHVENVVSSGHLVIDIYLSRDDFRLPIILAEPCAKILPPIEERNVNFDLYPVGTGPYRVVHNDDKRLILHAYDNYFGFRPLLDSVEVWVIDDAHSSMIFPSLSKPIQPTDTTNYMDRVDLDPWCTFLLLNRKNGLAASNDWAHYFSQRLSSLNLFQLIPQEKIVELGVLPAHGLKPGWYHHTKQGFSSPPAYRTITIAYHAHHPMFPTLVKCIESIFKSDGLSVNFITYELTIGDLNEVDIWIKPMGISTHREDALAGWLLNHSDIEMLSKDEDYAYWVEEVKKWQADPNITFPANELGKSLVERLQIIPTLHCWLGVSQDHCGALQNATCNALGWFDFSQVWVKPEETNDSGENVG